MCFQMCWGPCVLVHVIVAIALIFERKLFNVDWFFELSLPTFSVVTQKIKKKKKKKERKKRKENATSDTESRSAGVLLTVWPVRAPPT